MAKFVTATVLAIPGDQHFSDILQILNVYSLDDTDYDVILCNGNTATILVNWDTICTAEPLKAGIYDEDKESIVDTMEVTRVTTCCGSCLYIQGNMVRSGHNG